MKTMTKEEFLKELAFVLNEDELKEDQNLNTVADFDSMGVMGIVAMIDRTLKFRASVDVIRDARTVGDLVKLVAEKLT